MALLAVILVSLVFTTAVLSRQISPDAEEHASSDLELKLVHVVSEI